MLAASLLGLGLSAGLPPDDGVAPSKPKRKSKNRESSYSRRGTRATPKVYVPRGAYAVTKNGAHESMHNLERYEP